MRMGSRGWAVALKRRSSKGKPRLDFAPDGSKFALRQFAVVTPGRGVVKRLHQPLSWILVELAATVLKGGVVVGAVAACARLLTLSRLIQANTARAS